MDYVRQTINSTSLYDIFDIPQSLRDKEVEVIILPAKKSEEKKKIQLGFIKGYPLPESFFEPLPEEELKAWGL